MTRYMSFCAILWLAAGSLLTAPVPMAAAQDRAAAPQRAHQLTLEELERLPDDRIVEGEDGERITVGQLRAMRADEARAAAAHATAARREHEAALEALRQRRGAERAMRLEAENAGIMAVLERLRAAEAERAQIRQEAIDLYQRGERAETQERATLRERAEALLKRLEELDRAAIADLVPAPRMRR